jgi:sec-independent protein translocase protein TatC
MDSSEEKPQETSGERAAVPAGDTVPGDDAVQTSYEQTTDATPSSHYDEYGYENHSSATSVSAPAETSPAESLPAVVTPPPSPPPPPASTEDEDDGDDDGMLRMSFLEHLEELRSRILKALYGVGVAFVVSLVFVNDLWKFISEPAGAALREAGAKSDQLVMTSPTESFTIIWVKLPVLAAVFLASPWVLYQVWAFIAPGLYKKERRWAMPFVLSTAGLFILGGLFAYFVAFKLGLAFLLGIGVGNDVQPLVTITEYFDLFMNVMLGMGLVFELPILIFFLALLRIFSASFLVRNSRYAILIIVIIAAILTPTPDVMNLMLVAVPMTLLFFGGVFAAYLLEISRGDRRIPWLIIIGIVLGLLLVVAGGVYLAVKQYGYQVVPHYPFLLR